MAVNIYFHELLFDPEIVRTEAGQRFPISGSPKFANTVNRNEFTGISKTNVTRANEIREITMKIGLADAQDSDYFNNFWLGGFGNSIGFRFRYVPDYVASHESFAGPGGTQVPNGVTTQFKLYKTYIRPGQSDSNSRRIIKPIAPANKETNGFELKEPDWQAARVITYPFKIYFDTGAGDVEQASGWKVNVKTGVVTFTTPPATGTYIKWSGEYDTPVTFIDNTYTHNFDTPNEFEGIRLREILPAELLID
jgi:uncharacterized protein (TIGR02217 family)